MILNLAILLIAMLNILLSIFLVYRIKKVNIKKQSQIGTIILDDKNSFYIELNDEESINKIHNSDYVLFAVKDNIKTLN